MASGRLSAAGAREGAGVPERRAPVAGQEDKHPVASVGQDLR